MSVTVQGSPHEHGPAVTGAIDSASGGPHTPVDQVPEAERVADSKELGSLGRFIVDVPERGIVPSRRSKLVKVRSSTDLARDRHELLLPEGN